MIVMNCFRYLGFSEYKDYEKALYEINIMPVSEYLFRMKVYNLKRIDEEHDMHLQAWLNARVKDTDKKGEKPIYKKFSDFFNLKKREQEILGVKRTSISNNMKKAVQMASQINQKGG